jgi:hypothetical protein
MWRTKRGGEIDFLAGPRQELDVVVASKHELEIFDNGSAVIPVSLLAWALG